MESTLFIIILILIISFSTILLYAIYFDKKNVSNDKLYKIACTASILFSIIAIFLSIRINPFEIKDSSAFIGVIAGVIAVPTAILLAWQVQSTSNIQKNIDEIKSVKNDIYLKVDSEICKLKHLYQYDFERLIPIIESKVKGENIDLLCKSLGVFNNKKLDGTITKTICYEYAFQLLYSLSQLDNKIQEDRIREISEAINYDDLDKLILEVRKYENEPRLSVFMNVINRINKIK